MRSAFVLAAGKGERLRPYTLKTPKPLLPLKDGRPLLFHVLKNLEGLSLERVVLNAWYLKDQIHDFVREGRGEFSFELVVSDEDRLLGTGGGLKQALSLLSPGPLLILNGDCLWSGDLKAFVRRSLEAEDFSFHWWMAPSSADQTEIRTDGGEVIRIGSLWNAANGRNLGDPRPGTFSGLQVFPAVTRGDLPDEGCILRNYLIPKLQGGARLRADWEGLQTWTDIGTPERYESIRLS